MLRLLLLLAIAFATSFIPHQSDADGRRSFTFPSSAFNAAATDAPAMIRLDADADLARHAEGDGSNLQLVAQDGTPLPSIIGYTPTLLRDVSYTVASEPNAVRWVSGDGSIDRTFIGAFRHQQGASDLIQYDHLTGQMKVVRLTAAGSQTSDDHNGVTLAIATDGTVFAFTSDHNIALRIFRSTAPGDVSSMEEITTAVSTGAGGFGTPAYPVPFWLGDRLCFTWRTGSGTFTRYITWSDDGGDTWVARKEWIIATNDRPYPVAYSNGTDRVDVSTSRGLEREGGGTNRDLFHFYYLKSTNSLYRTNGTLIRNLDAGGVNLDEETPILTQASVGNRALRATSIYRDTTSGAIAIGTNSVGREDDATRPWTNDYGYLRWNGSAWTHETVLSNQETIYGPTTDTQEGYLPGWRGSPVSLNEFLASAYAPDATMEIRRYTRSGAGVWSFERLTSAHEGERLRPVHVRNPHPDLQLIYLTGAYDRFADASNAMDLCPWPSCGRLGRLRALVELDHTGSSDQTIWLTAADTVSYRQPPLAGAIYASPGEVGRRTLSLTSNAITGPDGVARTMHSLAGLTVTAAAVFPGSTATDRTFISNYGATSADNLMQCRFSNDSPSRIETVFNVGTGQTCLALASDITLTTGVKYATAVTWNGGTGLMRLAANGTLSTATDTETGVLRNPGTSPRLRTGIRATAGYADTVQVFGSIDGVVILGETKTTDWLRMASLGLGPAAYQVGDFIEGGSEPDSELIAQAVRTELAIELARLDAAVSTRSAPATAQTIDLTQDVSGLDLWGRLIYLDQPVSTAETPIRFWGILRQNGANAEAHLYASRYGEDFDISGLSLTVILSESLTGQTPSNTCVVSGSTALATFNNYTLATKDSLYGRVQFAELDGRENVIVPIGNLETLPLRVTNTRAEKLDDVGNTGGPVLTSEPDRILRISSRADGTYETQSLLMLPDETLLVAIDTARLVGNKRLYGMDAPVSSATAVATVGSDAGDYGVYGSTAMVLITTPSDASVGATATITVDVQPASGRNAELRVPIVIGGG